ncbi:DUF6508 domain-containing protein [Nocardia terpenica]|uniref:DUF6508 domain-containing protein n=1 Tax=Nocardia terpenica TaxID=455432 RepID=UPI0012FDE324|nr:DUF6508 domain-containing protein [Nocardia terpenica]
MEPSDVDIKGQLLRAPPDCWRLLWSAVDDLLAEQPSPWEIRTQNADGSLCMPYARYSDAVERVKQGLFQVNSRVRFDWPNWDGIRRYQGGRGLADAPVADVCRMLTAITHAERFHDGTIGRALDDGTFQTALLRLRRWYDDIADIHAEHIHAPPSQSWISRRISDLRTFQALRRD